MKVVNNRTKHLQQERKESLVKYHMIDNISEYVSIFCSIFRHLIIYQYLYKFIKCLYIQGVSTWYWGSEYCRCIAIWYSFTAHQFFCNSTNYFLGVCTVALFLNKQHLSNGVNFLGLRIIYYLWPQNFYNGKLPTVITRHSCLEKISCVFFGWGSAQDMEPPHSDLL